ncbi:MAG: tetratricopeptide repeat protein [Myxococcota bacterium]
MTAERRLAAILSADVVAYSRLMAEDEQGTIQAITGCRSLIGTLVGDHRGRVVDTPGDNILAEFPNALDAVQCAVEVQRVLEVRNQALAESRRMLFRIGVHLGDITAEGDSIYGDGVNIAARLEALAEAGGICVSADVQGQVEGKLELGFEDLGEQSVKNIPRPVRVSRVLLDQPAVERLRAFGWQTGLAAIALVLLGAILALAVQSWRATDADSTRDVTLPRETAVAVLPFANMSDDSRNRYFSDGISEEVLSLLAHVPGLRVISRTSSFVFGDQQIDLREVGRLLDVSHVLEGSVRKAGNRVRITAQLIRARDNAHVWSGSYDHELNDIFAVQAEVAGAIVRALQPALATHQALAFATRAAIGREAYDKYLEARFYLNRFTMPDVVRAGELFREALALEPTYARAHTGLAQVAQISYVLDPSIGWKSTKTAIDASLAEALRLGADDSETWAYVGLTRANYTRDWEGAYEAFQRALTLNPNDGLARGIYAAFLLSTLGRHEEAIRELERAERSDPLSMRIKGLFEAALWNMGNYAGALAKAREWLDLDPEREVSRVVVFRDLLGAGDIEGAAAWEDQIEGLKGSFLFLARIELRNRLAGKPALTEDDLPAIRAHTIERGVSSADYWTLVYFRLGDLDRALDSISEGVDSGEPWVLWQLRSKEFSRFRAYPRYQAILEKAGLDDASIERLGLGA